MDVAAPLAVLVSISVACVIIAQDWKKIHFRSTGWLVLATLFGIPLGLMLLDRQPTSGQSGAGRHHRGISVYALVGEAAALKQ